MQTRLWIVKVDKALSLPQTSTRFPSPPGKGSVTPSPAWPLSDPYCYIFPRPMKFLATQARSNLSLLPGCLGKPTSISCDRDSTLHKPCRHPKSSTTTKISSSNITALGLNLEHGNAKGEPIEWGGRRAWFDERAALARRYDEYERGGMENRNNALSDSYWEWDFVLWRNCRRELISSVTTGVDDGVGLPALTVIVDVEASDDVLSEASLT